MNDSKNSGSDIAQILGVEKPTGHQFRFIRWAFVFVVLAVLAVISGFWLKADTSALHYTSQKVSRGDLVVIVTATGTLQPTNEVEVGSELSGIIKSVEVDYNELVEADQVLAVLDPSKLEAQVTQSRAALSSTQANLLRSQATVKETQNKLKQLQEVRAMSNNQVPAQSEMDAAEAAYERAKADEAAAKASVLQAQATLDLNLTDLSKTVIHSPIKGLVLTSDVVKGQTVAAAFEAPVLFTIAEDLTQMELHVDVDEADVGRIMEGQSATFTVDAYPERTFQAVLTQVRYGAQTVNGVVTYETVLKVNNSELLLRPGMTATADITVQKFDDIVLIPGAALRFAPPVVMPQESSGSLVDALLPHPPRREVKNVAVGNGQQKVWMLKEGRPIAIPVVVGASDGSNYQLVKGDVTPEMELIVDTVSVSANS